MQRLTYAIALACSGCTLVEPLGDYSGRVADDRGGTGGCGGQVCTDAGAPAQAGVGSVPLPCGRLDCNDRDPCTDDACVSAACVHTVREGAECGDGNPCNGSERCDVAGICRPGTPVPLDDGLSCTTDTCDPATGAVSHMPTELHSNTQCLSVSAECPAGYYRKGFGCCVEACGACPYSVNAVICERICMSQLEVCCSVDPEGGESFDCSKTQCPPGFTKTGEVGSSCTCGAASGAMVCVLP